MADLGWSVGLAVDLTEGTPRGALGGGNATLYALDGAVANTDGLVLGDAESGDGQSGITIPTLNRVARSVAKLDFTEQIDTFLRVDVTNFAITIQAKGNGNTRPGAPVGGEAKPDLGHDALYQMSGLVGANQGPVGYRYTPRDSADSPTTAYGGATLWVGTFNFDFVNVINESMVMEFTPAEIGLITFNLGVGSYDPAVNFNSAASALVPTYGNQTKSAPVVQGVGSSWVASSRGWQSATVTIDQNVEDIADANQATGVRKEQTERVITADLSMFVNDADITDDHDRLIRASQDTALLEWDVGLLTSGSGDVFDHYAPHLLGTQPGSIKYNRAGANVVCELSDIKATSATSGAEFFLDFDA